MKTFSIIVLAMVVVLLLASCAAQPNPQVDTANDQGKVAGFWQGLWHGIISPFTFIISLFSKTVGVYDVHNNGNWYNFGFVLGCSIIFGGGGAGAGRRRG
jgi:hypothetical protein